jgi:ABC-type amino acid transport substrate-binding protein
MKRSLVITIGLVALLLGSVRPGLAEPPPLLPGLQTIVDKGVITVGTGDYSVPPLAGFSGAAALENFDKGMGNAIAHGLGVRAEFQSTDDTNAGLIEMVARGKVDIGLTFLAATPETGRYVRFTQPYAIEEASLLINRVEGRAFAKFCPGPSDVARLAEENTLGILEGGHGEYFLHRIAPNASVTKFNALDDMVTAVGEGKPIAVMMGKRLANYLRATNPALSVKLKLCVVDELTLPIAVAVRPGAGDLVEWLNLFLANRYSTDDFDPLSFPAK